MRYRKLQVLWSVTWVVVGLLLCLLWVRSYRTIDGANVPVTSTWSIDFISLRGLVGVSQADPTQAWSAMQIPFKEWQAYAAVAGDPVPSSTWGGRIRGKNSIAMAIPNWMIIVFTGALTFVPWIRLRWRFSLRTLQIATIVIALLL